MIEIETVYDTTRFVDYQRTKYSGFEEELIDAKIAKSHMFDVGKSGTKRSTAKNVPLTERYSARRAGKGRWEIVRYHEEGKPPYVPEQDFFWVEHDEIRTNNGIRYVKKLEHCHRIYVGGIESDYHLLAKRGLVKVSYYGTRQQLCKAGLANEGMFPKSASRYFRRKTKSSPENWGDWEVKIKNTADRKNPLGIWRVSYELPIHEAAAAI